MKTALLALSPIILLVASIFVVPQNTLEITIENPAATATAAAEMVAIAPSGTGEPAPTGQPGDPHGQFYFWIQRHPTPELVVERLVRLPGSCVVGEIECPEPETIPTPFDERCTHASCINQGLVWSPDGTRGAVLVASENLAEEPPLGPPYSLYLFDARDDSWRTLYEVWEGVGPRAGVNIHSWSPDGNWIAFSTSNTTGEQHFYLIQPDGTGLREVPRDIYEIVAGWVGGSLLVQRFTNNPAPDDPEPDYSFTMYLVNPKNGQETPLFTGQREGYTLASPDGNLVALADFTTLHRTPPYRSIQLLALDGKVVNASRSYPSENTVFPVAWSPDSSQVAFNIDGFLYLMGRDGEPRQVFRGVDPGDRIYGLTFSPDGGHLLLDAWGTVDPNQWCGVCFVSLSLETLEQRVLQWPGQVDESGEDYPHAFSWKP